MARMTIGVIGAPPPSLIPSRQRSIPGRPGVLAESPVRTGIGWMRRARCPVGVKFRIASGPEHASDITRWEWHKRMLRISHGGNGTGEPRSLRQGVDIKTSAHPLLHPLPQPTVQYYDRYYDRYGRKQPRDSPLPSQSSVVSLPRPSTLEGWGYIHE